jgi:hypothetical protein
MLRNGSAVAHLHLGNYPDAEKVRPQQVSTGGCSGEREACALFLDFEFFLKKEGASIAWLLGLLTNVRFVAQFALMQWQQALLDALTKGQNDPDTLVNLICCYQHMAKPEELLLRYTNIKKKQPPLHKK